jgi:hypothetical protein
MFMRGLAWGIPFRRGLFVWFTAVWVQAFIWFSGFCLIFSGVGPGFFLLCGVRRFAVWAWVDYLIFMVFSFWCLISLS